MSASSGNSEPILMPSFEDVDTYFGLSYASWLVWSRATMQAMPEDWQRRFVQLSNELDQATSELEFPDQYHVTGREFGGRFVSLPDYLCQYRRPLIEARADGKIVRK